MDARTRFAVLAVKGLNTKQLAERLGANIASVHRVLTGERRSPKWEPRIAEALQVDAEAFFGPKPERKRPRRFAVIKRSDAA